ncbi:MAG: aminopeptidase P N-terminal domain-containing protein [Aphanocapsa sp. GSE-SYN-MK-11-07L]|jgi:Xaa-Pro aminopeptidase|nr:aminopeptidase P N-terminal domain-containing protein [Aphanocapsa sp. GSE-SYN-MK-11-07L]
MQAEYQQRRQRLMEKIGTGVGVFRSAPSAVMHNDVEYNFRQDSDFFYLTGFDEPEAVAVLAPEHPEHRFVLFVRPKDPEKETWSGRRIGVEAAKTVYGADAAFPIAELDEKLPGYLEKSDRIYYRLGRDKGFNETLLGHWQQLMFTYQKRGTGPVALADPAPILHPLRQVKSDSELALMRQAIAISVEAHNLAQEMAKPGRYEYEVQAEMERLFRLRGGNGPAYPSIVAAGENACILHYTENTRQLQDGDLLLIDAGCAYGYYNADITRTFPVNGQFSREQKILYELVLAAQTQAIAQVKPGNPYNLIHDTAVRVLVTGLVELDLLTGEVETLITENAKEEKQKYKPFYMHRTGHWLGLDVHDVGVYKHGEDNWTILQPGQVLTVEPGIYISPDIALAEDQPVVGDRWRGIGIRIEDDVLVTDTGHEVLTSGVPK